MGTDITLFLFLSLNWILKLQNNKINSQNWSGYQGHKFIHNKGGVYQNINKSLSERKTKLLHDIT